jgi:putative transposase
VTCYRFVEAERANHPVRRMCRVLDVSASGYWAWRSRPPSPRAISDAALTEVIRTIHARSRGTYGVPRIHAELADAHGLHLSRKRVARLMRAAGLAGVHRRRGTKTTRRNRDAAPAPDLVQRDFRPAGPDRLWVADITYVPTWSGFLYLAVVLDAWSRRVIGWAMAGHLRSELIIGALEMALWRRPDARGAIFHSDQGTQRGFKESSQHSQVG